MQEREETDEDLAATSDESGPEEALVGLKRARTAQYVAHRPATTKEKARAIQECHDNPLAGYFRARRTLEKLQRRYL